MFSNKDKATTYFLLSLSTWFVFFVVYGFLIVINLLVFETINIYIKTFLLVLGIIMLVALYFIFTIKTITIDILGMGFNCIKQPVLFSFFGNSFSKHYQLDSRMIDRISFNEIFFKKMCLVMHNKKKKRIKISIPLYFFEKKSITKMKMQFIDNTYFNAKINK